MEEWAEKQSNDELETDVKLLPVLELAQRGSKHVMAEQSGAMLHADVLSNSNSDEIGESDI